MGLISSLPVFVLCLGWITANARAEIIQILHTNDLHSHFESGETREFGNYAAVKATIDRLRAEGQAAGRESVLLDAGDFTEGTLYYFAEEGAMSWRAMSEMGYDAVTLGNHDYLTGQADIDRLIRAEHPRFALLAANFAAREQYRDLSHKLQPSLEITRGGLKIGIVGITTEDPIYKWRAGPDAISSAQAALAAEAKRIRGRNDLVIALTHVGLDADKKMMKVIPHVDVVVGGHSHTALINPWMIKNPQGRYVPIVQAGRHGEKVGRLILEVVAGRPVRVVQYDLIPVHSNGPKDARLQHFVQAARMRLEAQLGSTWLHEVIGTSSVPMIAPNSSDTPWGNLFGDAMRRESGAEVSIDAGPLFGDWQPSGPITREKLLGFYPRTFEYGPGIGWSIWLAECDGWIINLLVSIFTANGFHVTLGGAQAGKLEAFKRYTIAVPESIGRALTEVAPALKLIFLNPRNTGIKVLDAVEREILHRGGQI